MQDEQWGMGVVVQCLCWEPGLLGENQREVHRGSRAWESSSGLGFCVGSSPKQHPRLGLCRKGPGLQLEKPTLDQAQPTGFGPLMSGDQEDEEFGFDSPGLETGERPFLNTPSDFKWEKHIISVKEVQGKGLL